jgi:hypothetical protein
MAIVEDRRERLSQEIEVLNCKLEDLTVENNLNRPKWAALKFEASRDLEEENLKWSKYRKEMSGRAKPDREIRPEVKLSSKVQDLLKSMALKGLVPK